MRQDASKAHPGRSQGWSWADVGGKRGVAGTKPGVRYGENLNRLDEMSIFYNFTPGVGDIFVR